MLKRVKSGLSSGEGLILQVRDPQYDRADPRRRDDEPEKFFGYEDATSPIRANPTSDSSSSNLNSHRH